MRRCSTIFQITRWTAATSFRRQVKGETLLSWVLNPFGVELGAYVVLWIALLVIVIGSVITAIAKLMFGRKP